MEVTFGSQKKHEGIWQRRDSLFRQCQWWWAEPLLGKEKVSCWKSRGHSGWGGTKGWQLFWRLPLAFKPLIHFCLRQVSPQASKLASDMAKSPLLLLLLHPSSSTGRVLISPHYNHVINAQLRTIPLYKLAQCFYQSRGPEEDESRPAASCSCL